MLAKVTAESAELFRSRLDQMIDLNHELVQLADRIDWSAYELKFGPFYSDTMGAPAKPIRLMVGLSYLSRICNLSDQAVVERTMENPYWQYFCGFEYFQKTLPTDPSNLIRWRKRIGKDGAEFLLQMTIKTAIAQKQITPLEMAKVNVDTTVQEKAIRFPTDARLYHRMLIILVKAAKKASIKLRQNCLKLARKAFLRQSRYAHAQQFKRAAKCTKSLKIYLGRVFRDITRKLNTSDEQIKPLLETAELLLKQQRNDKNKLYSIHEQAVECIAKGKIHKKYEYGNKVSVVSTSRNNWIVGLQSLHGNPFDGHTLSGALEQVKSLTGMKPHKAYVDEGYKGNGNAIGDTEIHLVNWKNKKKLTRTEIKWRKRRAAIEPIIGHLKSDHRMNRNLLKGILGDDINALLAACGKNLRKLMQIHLWLIFGTDILDKLAENNRQRTNGFINRSLQTV